MRMRINASLKDRMLSGVGALGLGLALIVIGYGLAPGERPGLAAQEIHASVRTDTGARAGTREEAAYRAIGGPATPAVTLVITDSTQDDSRECEPSSGIVEHCIFN
jgi:hypothetical protein